MLGEMSAVLRGVGGGLCSILRDSRGGRKRKHRRFFWNSVFLYHPCKEYGEHILGCPPCLVTVTIRIILFLGSVIPISKKDGNC